MSVSDQNYRQSEQISLKQIPKFQFQINNQELRSCIKQLNFNNKSIEKNVQKMKKQLDIRPTQNQITEALVVIASMIQIDPNLGKLLKTKAKKQQLGSNPINSSACDLGRKINQISQSVSLLNGSLKAVQKKVAEIQFSFKSSLNQKSTVLQQQIDETNSKMYNENFAVNQKIELAISEFGDKLREVETKTLWQINDCKVKLANCINQQYVKDIVKQVQGRMATKMKQQSIKQGAIDPERVKKIQQQISKNQKQILSQMTETNYKIKTLKQYVETAILSKKQNGEQKVQSEKRFTLINANLTDMIRRIRQAEQDIVAANERKIKLQKFQQSFGKQIDRVNDVLKNLKIGDDFQKMLQKMDPHRICALDEMVNDLQLEQNKLSKSLDLTRKQIDRLRSKTQFVGILTPNTGGNSKFTKQQVQEIVHDYFVNNMFAKKIQSLQSQFLETKAFPEMINELNKKLARMQKQTDNHSLIYQLKGLQQYVKRQVLIVNNRISSLQGNINDDKKRRPTSAMQSNGSEKKLGSSLSYKKLTPVNCISCYQSPMITPERKISKRY